LTLIRQEVYPKRYLKYGGIWAEFCDAGNGSAVLKPLIGDISSRL